ncbi:hypothetical protein BR93DRAFT_481379 [Coniochaeta sp. PMI_546]|nr:hypothetical protein BR93DRAFT_481379 [Coniochaeta sp. PMI_546]
MTQSRWPYGIPSISKQARMHKSSSYEPRLGTLHIIVLVLRYSTGYQIHIKSQVVHQASYSSRLSVNYDTDSHNRINRYRRAHKSCRSLLSGWRGADCGVSRDNDSRINRAVNGCTRTPCLSRDRKPHDGCCNIQQSHPEASSSFPGSECVVGEW